jgi:pentose-5-phosphate-3-epimerase
MRTPALVTSVVPADFSELGSDLGSCMRDGRFVPNLTFKPAVITASRRH